MFEQRNGSETNDIVPKTFAEMLKDLPLVLQHAEPLAGKGMPAKAAIRHDANVKTTTESSSAPVCVMHQLLTVQCTAIATKSYYNGSSELVCPVLASRDSIVVNRKLLGAPARGSNSYPEFEDICAGSLTHR